MTFNYTNAQLAEYFVKIPKGLAFDVHKDRAEAYLIITYPESIFDLYVNNKSLQSLKDNADPTSSFDPRTVTNTISLLEDLLENGFDKTNEKYVRIVIDRLQDLSQKLTGKDLK
jgi:hypothetical protein